ncbi:hypothetical protein [Pseudomonas syringae]|uniref:hypothetical protein n=1 Tax=Pseudomonas syringae TaxID=317 RepID=UPI0009ADB3D0|nr:hypothetical protein [Pseudomonas syringae]
MKQMIGTLFAAVLFGWVVYSISPEAPCERVERGALPVRTAFDAVRWLGKNYLSTDARIQLLSWSIDADIMSQHFISRLFYGPELNCAK